MDEGASMVNPSANLWSVGVAHLCVLIVALLPMVCAGLAKFHRRDKPVGGGFDNHNPRAWLAQQTGWRARATAAQANTFEAMPLFFVGLVLALGGGAPLAWVNGLCVAFVLCRVAFIGLYLADLAHWRSVVWTVGFACAFALVLSPWLR
jgi:uncharacterized MAPEG superfamily protein